MADKTPPSKGPGKTPANTPIRAPRKDATSEKAK